MNNFPSIAPSLLLRKRKYAGFTLVELIVVITILVILGTIAFLNLGNFHGSARDSSRVSDMTSISKGIDILFAKDGVVPSPDANMITITASGTAIGYQGYAGSSVLSRIKMSEAKDPLDKKYYTYLVNSDYTKYQILGLLEDSTTLTTSFIPSVYAGYETRIPSTKGSVLGVLLGNTGSSVNQPMQEMSMTGIDLTKTTTLSGYTMIFSKNNTTSVLNSGAGAYTGSLFTFAYNARDDLLKDKTLASYDPSLIGYWDMETMTGGKLKDLSKYGNDGTLNGGVEVGGVNGVKGKSGLFKSSDWTNNTRIETSGYNSIFDISDGFTVSVWIKKYSSTATYEHRIVGNRYNWNDANGWYITFPTNEKVAVSVGSMGGTVMRSNLTLDIGVWYNVLFTFYNGKITMYVNGEKQIQEQSGVTYSNTSYPLAIGGIPSGPVYGFDGLIDELRIYNRALSDSEIQTLYNTTK